MQPVLEMTTASAIAEREGPNRRATTKRFITIRPNSGVMRLVEGVPPEWRDCARLNSGRELKPTQAPVQARWPTTKSILNGHLFVVNGLFASSHERQHPLTLRGEGTELGNRD